MHLFIHFLKDTWNHGIWFSGTVTASGVSTGSSGRGPSQSIPYASISSCNNTSQWCELNILTSNIFKLHEKYVYFFFSWEKWQEICKTSTLKVVPKIALSYVRAFLLRFSVTSAVEVLEKIIVFLQYYNHTCVCGSYISWATVKLELFILRSPSMYSCIDERWCM